LMLYGPPSPDGVIRVYDDAVIQYLECIQNQMHWCKQAGLCKGTYISWDGEYERGQHSQRQAKR